MRDPVKDIVKRASAGTAIGGLLVFTGGLGVAAAQPPGVDNDGLVDVNIADITILEDADLDTAAVVIAQICDVPSIPPFLAPVDETGNPQESCRIEPLGAVTVVQNTADGTDAETTTETTPSPTDEATTTETTPPASPETSPETPTDTTTTGPVPPDEGN